MILRVAVILTAVLWAVTAVLLAVLVADHPRSFGALAAVESWLCAVALAATVTVGLWWARGQRSFYFEQGYIACAADMREPRVVSIASPRRPGSFAEGVTRKSNKVS
jgi:hypothetical protein